MMRNSRIIKIEEEEAKGRRGDAGRRDAARRGGSGTRATLRHGEVNILQRAVSDDDQPLTAASACSSDSDSLGILLDSVSYDRSIMIVIL